MKSYTFKKNILALKQIVIKSMVIQGDNKSFPTLHSTITKRICFDLMIQDIPGYYKTIETYLQATNDHPSQTCNFFFVRIGQMSMPKGNCSLFHIIFVISIVNFDCYKFCNVTPQLLRFGSRVFLNKEGQFMKKWR